MAEAETHRTAAEAEAQQMQYKHEWEKEYDTPEGTGKITHTISMGNDKAIRALDYLRKDQEVLFASLTVMVSAYFLFFGFTVGQYASFVRVLQSQGGCQNEQNRRDRQTQGSVLFAIVGIVGIIAYVFLHHIKARLARRVSETKRYVYAAAEEIHADVEPYRHTIKYYGVLISIVVGINWALVTFFAGQLFCTPRGVRYPSSQRNNMRQGLWHANIALCVAFVLVLPVLLGSCVAPDGWVWLGNQLDKCFASCWRFCKQHIFFMVRAEDDPNLHNL